MGLSGHGTERLQKQMDQYIGDPMERFIYMRLNFAVRS